MGRKSQNINYASLWKDRRKYLNAVPKKYNTCITCSEKIFVEKIRCESCFKLKFEQIEREKNGDK